jgi:hypothetical protein
MNKRLATFFSVVIIIVFIGYIVFDTIRPEGLVKNQDESITDDVPPDLWKISGDIEIKAGSLKSVTVSPEGNIYVGGDSFIQCFNSELKQVWHLDTPYPVTSLSVYGDTIYATTMELILIINPAGEIMDEWGPFETNGIFTSVTSNKLYVAVSDAGNKMVFILDKNGIVKSLIGQSGESFIIPSPYFDVALGTDNELFVANTGYRRLEVRTTEGDIERYFGEPGTAPEAFCGCCNPAHFISIPQGFATAEKGINRIKIINTEGDFVEFVSSKNKFTPSIPLDLASSDGKTIYAANPADSKVYIFTRN